MRLFRRKRSDYWWADVTIAGTRHRFSTKREDKGEATRVVSQFVRERLDASQLGVKPAITLGDALVRHIRETRRAADNRMTVSRARKILGGDLPEFPLNPARHPGGTAYPFEERFALDRALPLHEVTAGTVARLRAARMNEGSAPGTINREVSLLQTVYNRARREWDMRVAPDVVFKKYAEVGKLRYLSVEEEHALLRELDPTRDGPGLANSARRAGLLQQQLQDQYDLVVFLLDTGARYSEVTHVTWDSVDTSGFQWVNVYRTKVGNEGILAVTGRLREVLRRRRQMRLNSPYVFPGYGDGGAPRGHATSGVCKAMVRAGINTPAKVAALGKATVHTLRDTFASRLAEAGYPLQKIQKLLGHATPMMTQKYAKFSERAAASEAAEVLDRVLADH